MSNTQFKKYKSTCIVGGVSTTGTLNPAGISDAENGGIILAVDNKTTPTYGRMYFKNPYGTAYGTDGAVFEVGTNVSHIDVSGDASIGGNVHTSGDVEVISDGGASTVKVTYNGGNQTATVSYNEIGFTAQSDSDANGTISALNSLRLKSPSIETYKDSSITLSSSDYNTTDYPGFKVKWDPDNKSFYVGVNSASSYNDISTLTVDDTHFDYQVYYSGGSVYKNARIQVTNEGKVKISGTNGIELLQGAVSVSGDLKLSSNIEGNNTHTTQATIGELHIHGDHNDSNYGSVRLYHAGNEVVKISAGGAGRYPHIVMKGTNASTLFSIGNETAGNSGDAYFAGAVTADSGLMVKKAPQSQYVSTISFTWDSSTNRFVYDGVVPSGAYVASIQRGSSTVQSVFIYGLP